VRLLWFSDRVWRLVALAAALAVRFTALGRADLWTDEIQTLHAVQLPVRELVLERLHAGHVPVYFLVEKAWCELFGTSQLALRMPAAIFGVLLLLPAWSLLRRLAGEGAAWWGTALLAFHPLLVELSREARMYSLLALLVLVAADRAAAALAGERPGVTFWTAAVVGPLVHPTWAFAAVPLGLWLALEARTVRPESRRAAVAALAGIAASVALLLAALWFADPQRQELTRRPWGREAGVFVLRIFTGSELSPFRSFPTCAAVVACWCLPLLRGALDAPPRARRLALWWALGVPVASVASGVLGGVPWGPARYVETAAIGVSLLAAAGCAAMSSAQGRQSRAPVVVLFCALVCVFPLLEPRVAWSEAAAALRDDPGPVVVDDEPARIVLAHYLGREVFVGAPPPGAEEWRHAVLDAKGGERRVTVTDEPTGR
jgi:mannosyltransferase